MAAPKFFVDESKPWFNSGLWPDGVPKNYEFPAMTLSEMLDEQVKNQPEAKAIWFLDTDVTYEQLGHYVDSFATALSERGVKKGDVVTMLLPNSIQYVVCYYATVKIGAIASGINPTYKPLEILHQLDEVGSKVLVVLNSLYATQVAPIIAKHKLDLLITTSAVDLAYGLGFKRILGKLLKKELKGKVPGAVKFMDLLKTPPNVPKVEIDPINDPAVYMMTGGTTGVPKGAVLTHFNCVSNAIQCKFTQFDRKPGMAIVGILPLFHSFAMTVVMNGGICLGFRIMLWPQPPAMNVFVDDLLKYGPKGGTIFPGVEVLFNRLAMYLKQHPELKGELAGMFRLCTSGAGPLHRYVKDPFEQYTGAKLVEGYGLAEASPVVSTGPFNNKDQPGKIGLPLTGTDWGIFDAGDFSKGMKPIYPGEGDPKEEERDTYTGEICVCGPQVMKEYLNRPEETAETLKTYNGRTWLLTGDIGFMDATGQITIRDRKKQMIKVKGYAVFPKEVEDLIGRHEAVRDVAVAGIPDKETGELVKAWVTLKPEVNGNITSEKLLEWCRENLSRYKVPKEIEILDEIPMTMTGKVMRRTLQERDPRYSKK
ncbi:MAG: long-chain-fatty-acid--CoA ligase [Promethearchaeota archaeon CR_4]|nr:MAG: long-chain-fatty-acid--CoA ligase [Candidatus Lokiarchaeota archaeon CR_4]